VVEIALPDEPARLAILQVQVRGKPLAQEVRLETIAANTEGLTGADLGAICQHAALNAIRERIEQAKGENDVGTEPADASPLLIEARHFEAALNDSRK